MNIYDDKKLVILIISILGILALIFVIPAIINLDWTTVIFISGIFLIAIIFFKSWQIHSIFDLNWEKHKARHFLLPEVFVYDARWWIATIILILLFGLLGWWLVLF